MSKSLRKILRQDYKEVLDKNPDPNSQSWGRNIESRGMMCSEAFHALFTEKNDNADNEHELSEEDTRLLLVKLNLAWACESKMLFIPSLISDKNADDIRMKADIKIGLTGALTGPLAGTYAPAVEGLRLYIEEVNASGGINGESVELILQDDGMEPSRAAANSKRLMTQDSVVLMINSSLSSTYAPTINEAKRAGVPLLFAASACPKEVFPPADKNLFCSTGFGPSYDSQAALGFVKATAGTDVKIGFHAMTIPISRGEIDYAEKLSGDMGMTPVAKEISPVKALHS